MSETLDTMNVEAGKRPTFLTVLCILTFIGSAWGIIGAFMQDAGLDSYASYYKWVMILLNVGTLFGALQMWKMKKMGLYIYTVSALASVVLMWVVIKGYVASLMAPAMDSVNSGNESVDSMIASAGNEMVESAMNMALILGTIFPVLFLIMYWINAKKLS